jgi:hypothetical protein
MITFRICYNTKEVADLQNEWLENGWDLCDAYIKITEGGNRYTVFYEDCLDKPVSGYCGDEEEDEDDEM